MSTNKSARQELERLYGKECFIDKLHLREEKQKRYTGKGQFKRMKQLTYHHIKMKKDGGRATIENGALLSAENHAWFHKQSPEKQSEMNKAFGTFAGDTLSCSSVTRQTLKDDFVDACPLIATSSPRS